MDFDVRAVVLGFLAAGAVLAGLVWFVGVEDVLAAFRLLEPRFIALIVAVSLSWLLAWSLALQAVLHALGVDVDVWTAVLLYASAAFANNVTPFGQAGGEPFSALLISRSTGAEYERGLAAIASVDTLNFFPSVALALLGAAYYVAVFTVGDDLLPVLGFLVALAVGVPVVGYVAWQKRARLERVATGVAAPAFRVVGRLLPSRRAPSRAAVRDRVASFFRSVERVADSRRDLAVALTFSTGGWLAMALALWLSMLALGHDVPFAAAMIAVPLGTVASIAPLPGGLGGVEAALVLLLGPIAGVSTAAASAAVLVFRGATYWLPTLLGGIAAAVLEGHDGYRRA